MPFNVKSIRNKSNLRKGRRQEGEGAGGGGGVSCLNLRIS